MTDRKLFAPDVIEKDGRYYLYAYIVGSKGVVGVSDKPEGPFKLLSQYKYDPEDAGMTAFIMMQACSLMMTAECIFITASQNPTSTR